MDALDGLSLPSVAVHAGRTDLTDLGVHAVPIDLSTTAPLPDVSEARDVLDELIEGKPLPHGASTIYRRAWNPTVARFEDAVAALEGYVPDGPSLDVEGIAFASGMAATHVVILSRVAAGKPHVIAVRPLYGGTDAILESGILGTRVTYAAPDEIAAHDFERPVEGQLPRGLFEGLPQQPALRNQRAFHVGGLHRAHARRSALGLASERQAGQAQQVHVLDEHRH